MLTYSQYLLEGMDTRDYDVGDDGKGRQEAYEIARDRHQGRYLPSEVILRKRPNSYYAYNYVITVMKNNFQRDHQTRETNANKWRLLRTEELTPEMVEFLDFQGMTVEMQEYVLERRPDLISKMLWLDPSLKTKYKHESELSNADL